MKLSYYELDYAEKICISDDDFNRFVVHLPPVATYPGFLTFVLSEECGGEVIGKVDATFDFSNLPKHRHCDALNLIMRKAMLVTLGFYYDHQ